MPASKRNSKLFKFTTQSAMIMLSLILTVSVVTRSAVHAEEGEVNNDQDGLAISISTNQKTLKVGEALVLNVTVTNRSEAPLAFLKDDCYRGENLAVSFAPVEEGPAEKPNHFQDIKFSSGYAEHTMEGGYVAGSFELIQPGKSLKYSMELFLSENYTLSVESECRLERKGLNLQDERFKGIPPRHIGCGRNFKIGSAGICRLKYSYQPRVWFRNSPGGGTAGNEHSSKLWVGKVASEPIEIKIQ